MAHHRIKNPTGFTLIELVVVIVIIGILSVLGGQFIVAPIQGYVDLSRRAKLVDQAELALRRMQRDIRAALPNSIPAVSSGTSLTMINTVDGGRYRRYQYENAAGLLAGDILNFAAIDNGFDVLGGLRNAPSPNQYVVVYNVSSGDTDNRRKVAGGTNDHIVLEPILDPLLHFPQPSPYQRFFIVDERIIYSCDLDDRVLIRHSVPLSGEPVTEAIVTRGIEDCEFTYSPGTTQRAGLVTLKLTLNDKEAEEEKVILIHQVHVVNAP